MDELDFTEGEGPRTVFLPNPEAVPALETPLRTGKVRPRFHITIRDGRSGRAIDMLADWPLASLEDVALQVYELLGGEMPDHMEQYFWVYWLAWAGKLPSETAKQLPLGEELVNQIAEGVPLRGPALERFAYGLGWYYANQRAHYGDVDSWQMGTLSAPHMKSRRVLQEYIDTRMRQLVGEDYAQL